MFFDYTSSRAALRGSHMALVGMVALTGLALLHVSTAERA